MQVLGPVYLFGILGFYFIPKVNRKQFAVLYCVILALVAFSFQPGIDDDLRREYENLQGIQQYGWRYFDMRASQWDEAGKFDGLYLTQLYYYIMSYLPVYNFFPAITTFIVYLLQFNLVEKICLRYNLSKVIKYSFNLKIDKEERNKIENESKEIDLNSIYRRIPINTQYSKDFLLDILNYNIYYSQFQKVYLSSKKVEKEAKTKYLFFAGEKEYNRLRFQIQDIYKFDLYNSLLIDRYIEDIEIYRLFARAILNSACSQDLKDEYDNTDIGNIHTDKLNDFDIFICLKFMTNKELYDVLDSLCNNCILISEDANFYFKVVLKNISDNLDLAQIREYYYNSIILASYIKLNREISIEALDAIIRGDKKDLFGQEYKILKKLFANLKKQNQFEDKDVIEKLNTIIGLTVDRMAKSNCMDANVNDFLLYLLNIYSQANNKYYSPALLKIAKSVNYDILGSIYSFVSKRIQNQIRHSIKKWEWKDSLKDIEVYEKLVLNNLVEPNENVEEYVLENIDSLKNVNLKSYPDFYQQVIGSLLNLFLNDKIINKEEIIIAIKKSGYQVYLWLADPKKYNYEDFNINWLKLCSKKLLETMSEDEEIKNNILRTVRENVKVEKIDNESMKLILEYFV